MRKFILIAVLSALSACGGGGGGGGAAGGGATGITNPAEYTLPSAVSAVPPQN